MLFRWKIIEYIFTIIHHEFTKLEGKYSLKNTMSSTKQSLYYLSTYFSVGSVASLRSTVDDGMPSTWSMMCMMPFVAARLAWTTVAFTPPPSKVNVRFLPLVTTLKNKSLRGTRVATWKRWSIVDRKKPNKTKMKIMHTHAIQLIERNYC